MNMFLGYFLLAITKLLSFVLYFYMYATIARALVSWVNADPYNPIVRFLYRVTEPVLRYIRRLLPDMGGIDLSPVIVIAIIIFLLVFPVAPLERVAQQKINEYKYGSTPSEFRFELK